jgi:hypothetical protein
MVHTSRTITGLEIVAPLMPRPDQPTGSTALGEHSTTVAPYPLRGAQSQRRAWFGSWPARAIPPVARITAAAV